MARNLRVDPHLVPQAGGPSAESNRDDERRDSARGDRSLVAPRGFGCERRASTGGGATARGARAKGGREGFDSGGAISRRKRVGRRGARPARRSGGHFGRALFVRDRSAAVP